MLPTEASEGRGQIRDININIRVKRTQRDLIDQAAVLLGKMWPLLSLVKQR